MTEAGDIYLTVFWWTLGVLGIVWVILAGALVALRGRWMHGDARGDRRSAFDLAWTIAPAVIVLLVALPTVRDALEDRNTGGDSVDAVPTANAAQHGVEGSIAGTGPTGGPTAGPFVGSPRTPAENAKLGSDEDDRGECCEREERRKTTEEDDFGN